MEKSCNKVTKTQPPLRSDGSVAPKPQKHKPLPLDVTVYSEGARERFWGKVKKGNSDDCWLWEGSLTHDGYGRYSNSRKQHLAHRAAFRMEIGEIPEGLCVCHSCDTRACCNPNHLWLGTNWDNTLDSLHKGRLATGDRSGRRKHPGNYPSGDDHPFRKNPLSHAFGESVNTAKLRAEDVIRIRRLFGTGKHSILSLAHRFSVSESNIQFIVARRTWKHLP